MIRVEIDRGSGFCGGVIRAIGKAEEFLSVNRGKTLYSLGDIVHNEAELERLSGEGLSTINKEDLEKIPDPSSCTLLIRAHGEPPSTYRMAGKLGFNIIDCTCPVVLSIQESISKAPGQVVIFGKIGHAEVLGLVGRSEGGAVVVEDTAQLESALERGLIDTGRKVDVFSQTTKSPVGYEELCTLLKSRMKDPDLLTIHQTICSQVAFRHRELSSFARRHDVVVFVSGRTSSNGQVLSDLCRSVNNRTYLVGGPAEIRAEWFDSATSVGVCGATSTPKWLLEEVAGRIEKLV